MSATTLSETEANRLNQAITSAWNSKDPSNVIRIIEPNAVWRENENVFLGRNEIWAALRSRWEHTLHFQMRQELTSFNDHCIAVTFESEWQDSLHGQWYRESGHVEFTFDTDQLVTKIESKIEEQRISVEARRLQLDTTTRSN